MKGREIFEKKDWFGIFALTFLEITLLFPIRHILNFSLMAISKTKAVVYLV